MAKKLQGKVAIVTGASKGIGASIAIELAKEGAFVTVNYSSSKEAADKVVAEIQKNGGKAIAVQANLSKEEEIPKLFSENFKAFGKLDILVNNAGVYDFIPLEEVTSENYHKMFDLNVLGLLLASKEALKYFKGSGNIINIGSVAGKLAPATASIYSGTKAAVDAITISLAKELGSRNIRVNTINPGMVDTEGSQAGGFLKSDFREGVQANTPLGRIGKPSDIAPAVVYFASDDSSWITGEALYISGGYR